MYDSFVCGSALVIMLIFSLYFRLVFSLLGLGLCPWTLLGSLLLLSGNLSLFTNDNIFFLAATYSRYCFCVDI